MRMEGTQTKLQQLWHNRVSPSSCESRGVVYNPHGGEDPSLEKKCEEEVGDMDRSLQRLLPSAALLAQYNKVNEAIQCDMSWLEHANLGRSPESSPGGRKGTGKELVLCGDLSRKEVGEQGSRPSTAQLAQPNKIHEAVHCDIGWLGDVEMNSPEQMPLVSEESPNCTATGPRKLSGSRKLKEATVASLKGNNDIATLTKEITSLNISDEYEWEDEEIEWVFEEEVSGLSSNREESWGSYFCSLLCWPCSNKINKRNDECEGLTRSLLS